MKENLEPEEAYYPAIKVTEETGRVHAGCASFEYLPSKAFENLDYIIHRDQQPAILEGNLEIEQFEKKGSRASMQIQNSQEATVELPYIYYIGYKAHIETNGTKQALNLAESPKGFLEVHIPKTEEAIIHISYTGTFGMKLSYIITGLTILTLCIMRKHKMAKK